jgi:hypothetical protein
MSYMIRKAFTSDRACASGRSLDGVPRSRVAQRVVWTRVVRKNGRERERTCSIVVV